MNRGNVLLLIDETERPNAESALWSAEYTVFTSQNIEEAAEVIRGALQLMKPLTACSPIPLMSDLEPADLHNVVKALELQTVRPGQRIYRAAANLPGLWWLVQGEVEIGSRGRAFSAIGQGAIKR